MVDQKELKEVLNYDPETGVFIWKVANNNRIIIGDIAGCIKSDGYRYIQINSKRYKAHRLAWLHMTGKFPNDQIDHINHIKDDNAFFNLREATYSINSKNCPMRKDNTSGITGVHWYKRAKKWHAEVKTDGKKINLGFFVDKFEAICARKSAEIEHGFHPNHGRSR